MKIYLIIHTDRHVDSFIVPYKDRERALVDAERRARDMATHYHVPYVPVFSEIVSDGWLFRFAVEDVGEIRVEGKELIE